MPKPDHIGTCETCANWEPRPLDDGGDGLCKAATPLPLRVNDELQMIYPATQWDDWCGAWRKGD